MAPYRLRTKLREMLPWAVAERIPKGSDCGHGRHEWYLVEDGHWGCYHCVRETHESPWDGSTWAKLRMQAIYTDLAALMESAAMDGGLRWSELEDERKRYADELDELGRELESVPCSVKCGVKK